MQIKVSRVQAVVGEGNFSCIALERKPRLGGGMGFVCISY